MLLIIALLLLAIIAYHILYAYGVKLQAQAQERIELRQIANHMDAINRQRARDKHYQSFFGYPDEK